MLAVQECGAVDRSQRCTPWLTRGQLSRTPRKPLGVLRGGAARCALNGRGVGGFVVAPARARAREACKEPEPCVDGEVLLLAWVCGGVSWRKGSSWWPGRPIKRLRPQACVLPAAQAKRWHSWRKKPSADVFEATRTPEQKKGV